MTLKVENEVLNLSGLTRLSAENYREVIDKVRATLTLSVKWIEVDLSEITFIDSQGLSALIAFQKSIGAQNGFVRLLRPTRVVQQILEITRLDRIFEIIKE